MFSLKLLEYEKVLHIVKDYCSAEYSKKKLLRMKPGTSQQAIEEAFSELKEALFVIDSGTHIDLARIHDTTALVEKSLIKNNYLESEEIARIRENISTFISLRRRLGPFSKDIPLITAHIGTIRIPGGLREKIDKILDEHAHIKDDATPRLFDIQQKLREVRHTIEKILESYFNSQQTRDILQERHITLKDDRYVIPVKHNFKGRIPGIIHAHSGSGETVFLEPFSITQKNNELKLLQKEKEKELRRILVAITSEIGKHHTELTAIQEILSDIDILNAKCEFMKDYRCTIPEFSDRREIKFAEARHPLIQGKTVPIDFSVKGPFGGVVITGPNTGGKTVSLKTIGLFVLLAQSGFPVPAKMMRTYVFDSVFADIGDEQSIEQSLSTFSGHIKNIKKIVDEAHETSLVLIDELGAGTDPVEGGALGTAILDYLIKEDILAVVTTHFSAVKMYALNSKKVQVASVQFDTETCKPTYKLVIGIPGRSNALDIARHLGIEKKILDNSLIYLSERDRSIDRIFKNLGKMEIGLSRREEKVSMEEKKLSDLTQRYQQQLKELQEKEQFIRTGYKRQLEGLLTEYSKRLEKSIREIKDKSASKEAIKAARDEKKKVEQDFIQYEEEKSIEEPAEVTHEFKVGEYVRVRSKYGGTVKGEIIDIKAKKLTVQAGIFRLTVDADSVVPAHVKPQETAQDWEYERSIERSRQYECDIRGKRFHEAMDEVAKFLDNAVLQNIKRVSIIHGLGTGALRQGVVDYLRKNAYVEHYEYAPPEQGGFGCTIVTLKSQ